MKILEIQSCEECFNRKSCGNHWFCGITNSNIFGSTIPDWGPLPDRHLTNAMHSDSEGHAILENVEYDLEYVDSETIRLTRRR